MNSDVGQSQLRRTVAVARRIEALWSQPARRRLAYVGRTATLTQSAQFIHSSFTIEISV